jgi:hypothetical protein
VDTEDLFDMIDSSGVLNTIPFSLPETVVGRRTLKTALEIRSRARRESPSDKWRKFLAVMRDRTSGRNSTIYDEDDPTRLVDRCR